MPLYNSPQAYVFNLQTTSSAEAKRLWRKRIKEEWGHKCAYCGSEEELTLDHVVPRSKGGADFTKNVVCPNKPNFVRFDVKTIKQLNSQSIA